jgi:hypothetical protein
LLDVDKVFKRASSYENLKFKFLNIAIEPIGKFKLGHIVIPIPPQNAIACREIPNQPQRIEYRTLAGTIWAAEHAK